MRSLMFLRIFSLLAIFAMMVAVAPARTQAATTAQVVITATLSYIAITNAPTTWAPAAVAAGGTVATADDYFVITNTSTTITDISLVLSSDNFTGGGQTWLSASNGVPGSMIVGLSAGIAPATYDKVITTSATPVILITSLATLTNDSWHMKLRAPTVYIDGAAKVGTVTITAAAH
jgi:ABC-type transport system substrate-binding protein